MNIKTIPSKNETENFLLTITKNFETNTKQTHTRPQQTLEFRVIQPKETFLFNPPNQIEGSWLTGLLNLEVHISIFNRTEENTKIEIYTDIFDEFSFIELKDELEEILDISNITHEYLQKIVGPRIVEAFKKIETEKRKTDDYYMLLLG